MGHDPKFQAWYATLQGTMRSFDRITREVEAQTGVPPAWLEVLFFLCKQEDDTPGGGRRMSDLADQALLTRGGATRLIARMEEAGLVRRETPADDRRATYAVPTAKAFEVLERAAPVQRAAVERYFGAAIESDAQAEELRQLAIRVLELVGERCDWVLKDLTRDEAR